jgi:UPF0755 protein
LLKLMPTYKRNKQNNKYLGLGSSRFFIILAGLFIVIVVGSVATLRLWYTNNLQSVSSDTKTVYFTVESGESKHEIATDLKQHNLIRNQGAFENYLRSNEIDILQAGTYSLSPSMSVQTIVNKMHKGDVTRNLLTILPGKRVAQIKEAFIKSGYSQSEVDAAFEPANYAGHPALANLPAGATLEGFLYPDSFQKDLSTAASTIVAESLDEMNKHLTQDVVNGFAANGLNVFQGVTLASIVNQETDDPKYQSTVAQVFYSRIKQGIKLESNVTANYAADERGVARNVGIDSLYNTYLHAGLTPGPIGNVTASAMNGVAHPANTDYVYFIAGDDEKIHFSHTLDEHNAAIKQYCQKKCAQP